MVWEGDVPMLMLSTSAPRPGSIRSASGGVINRLGHNRWSGGEAPGIIGRIANPDGQQATRKSGTSDSNHIVPARHRYAGHRSAMIIKGSLWTGIIIVRVEIPSADIINVAIVIIVQT